MSIPPISGASGAARDNDLPPTADDEAPEPRPTRQPQQDRLGGLRSSPRPGRSDAPPDSEIDVSGDGSTMSVTATGGSTVFAVMGGNVIFHGSSGSPQPLQNMGGPSGTTMVSRFIDAIHDSIALETVVKLVSRASERDQPALFAATARRLATLLNEPNGWTDAEKLEAFVVLVDGATDALNRSREPNFEQYADTIAAFAKLTPHLPGNEEVASHYMLLAGLMDQLPLPPQHLEAPTNALFQVAKGMPQRVGHNLFVTLTRKMNDIEQGERGPMLNAMTSNLDALEHSTALGKFLLFVVALGYEESESRGRSVLRPVLERVVDRFGPYLDGCKESLSETGDETRNFHLLLQALEPDDQGDTHPPALAGLAAICDKLPLDAQGPAFDKILQFAARSAEPGVVLKSLIDVLPTIDTSGYEDRHRQLRAAIEACGKPQSDELLAQLVGQHRAS